MYILLLSTSCDLNTVLKMNNFIVKFCNSTWFLNSAGIRGFNSHAVENALLIL